MALETTRAAASEQQPDAEHHPTSWRGGPCHRRHGQGPGAPRWTPTEAVVPLNSWRKDARRRRLAEELQS